MTLLGIYVGPEIRALHEQVDDASDLIREATPKPRHFSFVVQGRLMKILLRLRVKLEVHPPRRDRNLSNTSGPGTPLTLPSTSSL